MGYKSEHLVGQVREVREASGLSQRALSDRTGQTQSHISQIESGKMEPGLSSFIDMARALDLEVVLVPKKLLPAVNGLMRAQATPDMHIHAGQPNDKRFARAQLPDGKLGELVDLVSTIGFGVTAREARDVLGQVYEYFLGMFASVVFRSVWNLSENWLG